MRKFFTLVVIVAVALAIRTHFQQKQEREVAAEIESERREFASLAEDLQPERDELAERKSETRQASYRCDGRTRCPQMHSCEEATWFLENCTGMKMDGDGDGVPCEDQHCGHGR